MGKRKMNIITDVEQGVLRYLKKKLLGSLKIVNELLRPRKLKLCYILLKGDKGDMMVLTEVDGTVIDEWDSRRDRIIYLGSRLLKSFWHRKNGILYYGWAKDLEISKGRKLKLRSKKVTLRSGYWEKKRYGIHDNIN